LTPPLSRDRIPITVTGLPLAKVRLGATEVGALLRVSTVTARRRLRAWHRAGTPRVERTPSRRGEPAYTITRAELARAIPEIDDA
jgi:hypothetical protein